MFEPLYFAVRSFFRQATHLGSEVEAVFARPDRAFQEMSRVYKKRLEGAKVQKGEKPGAGVAATNQAIEDRPFPLPFMSVWMPQFPFDPRHFNPGRWVVSKDTASGTAVTMRMPRPVLAPVTVELWTETTLEAGRIVPQIDLRFVAESAYLPVDWTDTRWYRPPFNILEHAKVLGKTRVRLIAEPGWVDNSELEEGDGRKITRTTWSGKLEARIPYMPTEARLVRTVNFQVYDDTVDPPELLVEDAGGVED